MILLTGASGFLGGAVRKQLTGRAAFSSLLTRREGGIDLREAHRVVTFLTDLAPQTVIHLAYPGTDGIGTSLSTPADLAHDVLQIDLNVIDACAKAGVQRLISIGSVCSYPEHVTFPTDESQLFSGAPESVNAPYGHAKRMQLALLDAYHRQYGLQYSQLILSNLYGPGDRSGHVIPATIRKVLQAKQDRAADIVVWGDGTASREFLFVEDAAAAVVQAALAPTALNAAVNICSGEEITIRGLVFSVCQEVDYWGAVQWDPSKPNGQPRRAFDNRRAVEALGWTPQVAFSAGIRRTIHAMQEASMPTGVQP